jgi:hypothetical protein
LLHAQHTQWKAKPRGDAKLFATEPVKEGGTAYEPKIRFGLTTTGWEPKNVSPAKHVAPLTRNAAWPFPTRYSFPDCEGGNLADDKHNLEEVPAFEFRRPLKDPVHPLKCLLESLIGNESRNPAGKAGFFVSERLQIGFTLLQFISNKMQGIVVEDVLLPGIPVDCKQA